MSDRVQPEATEQLQLLRAATRPRPPTKPAAAELPVARVAVDVPLPHLDRPFDYGVPEVMSEHAQPGVRVRVRFAGQEVDGYLLERAATTEHAGRLTPLRRLVGTEPVLSTPVLRLARAVADHYGGILADVLRLAVPPRHARAEQGLRIVPARALPPPDGEVWSEFVAGPAFLQHLSAGHAPRAVWTPLPGHGWAAGLVAAVEAALAGGRGAIVVLPDGRDVDTLEAALLARLGRGHHARLEADLGPQARYRAFLALRRGEVRVAIGTRAAAFAPVDGLGLVAIWEDGDDAHVEQRAPYPHPREVLGIRAGLESAAMLVASWSRTAEASALVRTGWAREVSAERGLARQRWPRVVAVGGEPAEGADPVSRGRLPAPAWRAAHDGLVRGPVLVQVPRAGYLPGTSCQNCRKPARCEVCHGPVGLPGRSVVDGVPAPPTCGWCARVLPRWTCPHCGDHRLRARATGVDRTAEELGRAFAGARVVVPRAGEKTPPVTGHALVVATPGLEPAADGGYAAALLLDGHVMLERPELRSGEQALSRWRSAAALVRAADAGGLVIVCADPAVPAVQALIRGDPASFADRELDERTELGFPPAVTIASLTGVASAVSQFADALHLPPGAEILGPVPVEPPARAVARARESPPQVRLLVRVPRAGSAELARLLHEQAAARSARRLEPVVRIQIDPRELV